MNQNKFKTPGDTKPDWICSNSACKNEKGYRTGVWNKKEGGFEQYAQRPTPKPVEETTPVLQPVVSVENAPKVDVGQQMNRSNLSAAAIRSGRKLDLEFQSELEQYENWVLNRKWIPF